MAKDKFGQFLRNRIVDDFKSGIIQKDIARKYNIHKSTISRIIKHFKTTGTVQIMHKGGVKRKTTPKEDSILHRAIKKTRFCLRTCFNKA